MALVLKDRVLESSTSTGAGTFTLTGAQTGYQSFTAIGNGNTTYYTIQGKNPDGTLTGEWEVGIGTWSTGNTLSRDTVLSNSLGTTAKIVFSAGDKDVFCDYPASKSVNQNADNKVLIPYTPGVTDVGSLNVGDATVHTDSGVIAAFTASEPLYLYTSLQNTSSANTSYASYAVNDGGHTSYGELGINNSNYSYTAAGFPNNTFSAPLATFVESYGGPLAIGTWDSQKISFIVNGSVNTADAMTISAAGVVSLGTALGVTSGGTGTTTSTGTGSVVLNTRPTMSVTGTGFTLQDATDNTKQANFVLSSIPTATTYAYTLPNVSGTLAALNLAQTFSNPQTFSGNVIFSTGNFNVNGTVANIRAESQTTGVISLGGPSQIGTLTFGQSTVSQTTNIQAGATASGSTKLMNIGTGGLTGSTTTIGIGSTAGTSTTTLNGAVTLSADTQALNFGNSQTTGTIAVGGTGATGAITLGQSTGAQTVNIATGVNTASNKTVNIATGGTFNTFVTVGNTAGAGTLTFGQSTGGQTVNIANGATLNATTKTVNIGANGAVGSQTNINVGNTARPLTCFINLNGIVTFGTSFSQTPVTVANLPSGANAVVGDRYIVSNALAPVFGANVAGGGAVVIPVYYDGTNWKVG